ncbi:MAG: hypothetical protein ACI85K_001420 [Hyphomicrobiaceae bacterium]
MHEVVHAAKVPGFPKPLFIHRASTENAEAFFASRLKNARAISDPDGVLFQAFGLRRGTLLQLLGPRAVWRGLVAMLKGNFIGKPTGSETQMPGAFLVRNREILWEHRAQHAGEHPDLDAVVRALNSSSASPTSPAPQPLSRGQTATIKKLENEYLKMLTAARDLQRSGDIQAFAAATDKASKIADEIDALKPPRS